MAKFIVLAAVIAVLFWLWRASQRRAGPPSPPDAQPMTRCARCGVHFPRGEAVVRDGRDYCCERHSLPGEDI